MNSQKSTRARATVGGLLTAVAATALVTPSPANAGPVERLDTSGTDISCTFETAEGDGVYFFASVFTGTPDEAGFVVESPSFEPILWGAADSVSFGPTFSATVPLFDLATGEPVGEASIEATMTPVDVSVEQIHHRDGNHLTKGTVTFTEFEVEVTSIVVPGYTVLADPDACDASGIAFDVMSTNPTASVAQFNDFDTGACEFEGSLHGALRLSGDIRSPRFDVNVEDAAEPASADGQLLLRGWSGSATVPLIGQNTGEPVGQDLTISVSLDRADRRGQESFTFDRDTLRVSWVPYIASITVTTTDGRSGTADCYVENVTVRQISRP